MRTVAKHSRCLRKSLRRQGTPSPEQFRPEKTTLFRRFYQDFGRFLEDFGRVSSRHRRLGGIPNRAALGVGQVALSAMSPAIRSPSVPPRCIAAVPPQSSVGPMADLGLSACELPRRRTYRTQARTRSSAGVALVKGATTCARPSSSRSAPQQSGGFRSGENDPNQHRRFNNSERAGFIDESSLNSQ